MRFDIQQIATSIAAGLAYNTGLQAISPLEDVIRKGLVRLPYPNARVAPAMEKIAGGNAFAVESLEGKLLDLGTIKLIDQVPGGTEEFVIQNAVVSLNIAKNIVETPTAGKDFSVIEIVSNENWQLTITAYIIDETGNFPEQQLISLRNFFFKNRELKVENDYLRMLDIHYIVVQSLSLPDAGGFVNVIPYQINAVNDTVIDLELK